MLSLHNGEALHTPLRSVQRGILQKKSCNNALNSKWRVTKSSKLLPNSNSWIAAKENENVAHPFGLYCDGEMSGFYDKVEIKDKDTGNNLVLVNIKSA